MKKNNNSAKKQSANSIRITDIPAIVITIALIAKTATKFTPASVSDVLLPISLIVGGLAVLTQAILWLCAKIKPKKAKAS